jgi:hypothetical protein
VAASRGTLALLAVVLLLTSVAYMPVCNAVFGCGCTWPWLGGVAHCNVRNPAPPHCPVCQAGVKTEAAGFFAIATPLFALGRLLARFARGRSQA